MGVCTHAQHPCRGQRGSPPAPARPPLHRSLPPSLPPSSNCLLISVSANKSRPPFPLARSLARSTRAFTPLPPALLFLCCAQHSSFKERNAVALSPSLSLSLSPALALLSSFQAPRPLKSPRGLAPKGLAVDDDDASKKIACTTYCTSKKHSSLKILKRDSLSFLRRVRPSILPTTSPHAPSLFYLSHVSRAELPFRRSRRSNVSPPLP